MFVELKFITVLEILGKIGGLTSSLLSVMAIIIFSKNRTQWFNSISREVNKSGCDKESEEDRMKELSFRVSYKGIYKLHDHVKLITEHVDHLKKV